MNVLDLVDSWLQFSVFEDGRIWGHSQCQNEYDNVGTGTGHVLSQNWQNAPATLFSFCPAGSRRCVAARRGDITTAAGSWCGTINPRSTVALILLGSRSSSLRGVVEGGRFSAPPPYVCCRHALVLHRLHSGSGTAPAFRGVSES